MKRLEPGWKIMGSAALGVLVLILPGCSSSAPVAGRDWTSPSTGMEFVWMEEMRMWVGKFEVTNEEYRKKIPGHNARGVGGHSLNGDRQPAIFANFYDAAEYAEWITRMDGDVLLSGLRYRLPSEDEWTRFARCGDGREYPWGNQWPPPGGEAGNYADGTAREELNLAGIYEYRDGHAVSAPVDELWVNPWGLYGVGGNVWEACAGDSTGGAFGGWRGGSWQVYYQSGLRVSSRAVYDGFIRNYNCGFRLVLSR